MAECVLTETETLNSTDPSSDKKISPFRKIDFVPMQKPFKFKSFSNDFHLETLNPTPSEPRTPGSAPSTSPAAPKKHDTSELSEFGLDPELSIGITFRRIGAGLRNLGNTCFLNSVLQCLTYTEPLAAYLQSGKHKSSCRVAGFCALCAIQNHVSRALQSTGRILSPEALVGNLRCISRNFRNARQEDAHEYMVNLLESMHKCCLPSGVPSESPGAYEKSLVHKIFGGRLRSQVKCQHCSYCSNKYDPFLDLSLEIFKADSLQKALANFTAAELLDGGERQYQCQRCKQKVRALKQLTIHKAPYVLTIHLKRFHAHDPGQKIKKKVQFGCALDLKPFVSGSYDGDVKYSLYGVLVHAGSSTHSGHYYCYVRTSNNMWYTLDDNRVNHVSEREVLNQQAYMLFYVRDRKSAVPRKAVDTDKKENMKTTVNGNRDSSASIRILKEQPNGTAENKLCTVPYLTLKAQENRSNLDSSRVPFIKDPIHQQQNGTILAESLMQHKKPISQLSSNSQIQKDSPDVLSVAKSELESLSSFDHSRKYSSLSNNLKCLVEPIGDKIEVCNENEISREGNKDSLSAVSTCTDPKVSTSKHATDGTSKTQEVGTTAADSVRVRACDIVCKNAVGSEGWVFNDSVNGSLNAKCVNRKLLKKSKRKFLKNHIAGKHLRSTMFFMAYLSTRKKSHKKSKRRILGLKNLNEEKLVKRTFPSDAGPSTAGNADVFSCVSSCFESKATQAGHTPGAKVKSNDKSLTKNSAEGEFRKRIGQNCAFLATTPHVESMSGHPSVVNQFQASHAGSLQDGKRDQMHNSLMNMLTRGLEETVVARWDDIELPSSHSLESKIDKNVSIGYVGDEWDEEYDKGKRKKTRSFKHNFDGPNPFQALASEKSKFKRAKLDRSSSGNMPFRI